MNTPDWTPDISWALAAGAGQGVLGLLSLSSSADCLSRKIQVDLPALGFPSIEMVIEDLLSRPQRARTRSSGTYNATTHCTLFDWKNGRSERRKLMPLGRD